jgi:hypothetical protein
MRVLKAKKKKVIEGREKPVWNDVGFTLLIGDWQGKTTYTLVDDRIGEKYSFFDIEYKKSGGDAAESTPDPVSDDVPF